MTHTNRRAEEFDRALSARGAHADPTIAALVAVAGALATVPKGPAASFRDGLRTRLMAEAASIAAAPAAAIPAAAVPTTPLQTLAKVLAKPAMQVATGGLAATIAVAGVGAGAARSLPGDALYGLRRAVAGSGDGLGDTTARIEDVVALLERDGHAAVGTVEATLDDIRADLDATTAALLEQVRNGSRVAYEQLAATVADLSDVLQALRAQLPPEARDELDAAMATVNAARAQLAALPKPGDRPGPVTPTATVPTRPSATTRPSTPPSSTPPSTPTISPSTPTLPTPTVPVPTVTAPPVPTVEPTLPVSVPPLMP